MKQLGVGTDKPRHTITLKPEVNKWFIKYCEETGLSKSDAIERLLRISIAPRVTEYARKNYQTPERVISMALDRILEDCSEEV